MQALQWNRSCLPPTPTFACASRRKSRIVDSGRSRSMAAISSSPPILSSWRHLQAGTVPSRLHTSSKEAPAGRNSAKQFVYRLRATVKQDQALQDVLTTASQHPTYLKQGTHLRRGFAHQHCSWIVLMQNLCLWAGPWHGKLAPSDTEKQCTCHDFPIKVAPGPYAWS